MKTGFETLHEHRIPMHEFCLSWRFTDEKYDVLPNQHLEQLQPLDEDGALFLWNYIAQSGLCDNTPFRKGFFRTMDQMKMEPGNEREVKKWLYRRGLPFNKLVYLSWQPDEAMIVPWKLFIKYFDSFYYPASDDLIIIDASLSWALLFYHEDEIYFGTHTNYSPGDAFEDIDFIW